MGFPQYDYLLTFCFPRSNLFDLFDQDKSRSIPTRLGGFDLPDDAPDIKQCFELKRDNKYLSLWAVSQKKAAPA